MRTDHQALAERCEVEANGPQYTPEMSASELIAYIRWKDKLLCEAASALRSKQSPPLDHELREVMADLALMFGHPTPRQKAILATLLLIHRTHKRSTTTHDDD